MKKSSLALAAGCAVLGAAFASIVVPAGADQTGSPAGAVTIQSPSVRQSSGANRDIFPRFKTSGNIETSATYLTVKQGTKTIANNQTGVVTVKKGTYKITTKVNYRYVTFRSQAVQVITTGNRIADISGPYGNGGNPEDNPAVVRDCSVTSIDDAAKTFAASCELQYRRVYKNPKTDEFDVTLQDLGSMTFEGTYEGTVAKQNGYADSSLSINPQVGGKVTGDDLRATKDFRMTFFNRTAGPFHSKSTTMTVTIDKTVL